MWDALGALGRADIVIVVGGVIPPADVATPRDGAAADFPPRTVVADSALDLLARLSADIGR